MRREIIASTEDGDAQPVELIRPVTMTVGTIRIHKGEGQGLPACTIRIVVELPPPPSTYIVEVAHKATLRTTDEAEAWKEYENRSGISQIGA
jgi:hypothetical protein